MPPPLPLLCSSLFLLLLLCRPSLANGRVIRLDASSPEPSPQFDQCSVASSTVTASPPAGRLDRSSSLHFYGIQRVFLLLQ
jgi:hypothetical protein